MSSTEKLGKMLGKQQEPRGAEFPNSRSPLTKSLANLMRAVSTAGSKKDFKQELMPEAKDTERRLYIKG